MGLTFSIIFIIIFHLNIFPNDSLIKNDYSTVIALAIVSMITIFSTTILGFYAGTVKEKRRKKLMILACILYYISALIISTIIIFFGDSYPDGYSLFDKIYGVLMLSLSGSLLLGIIFIPLLIIFVFKLEKLTRLE